MIQAAPNNEFWGYERESGGAGVRNKVLILPMDRFSNQIAWAVENVVAGVARFITPGDMGKHSKDRDRLFRVVAGLACNPNVHSVLLIGVRADFNYPETRLARVVEFLEQRGKRFEVVMASEHGGMGQATLTAQKIARKMVREAALQRRVPVPLSNLTIGIKCGISDGTSGIAGNPALGAAMDCLVDAGGTVIFSETTEIIGAEAILAERAVDDETRRRILDMVARTEAQARSVGEDIRSINPIPSNIRAGISTLEEKSLGAIAKGGTSTLQGALEYATQPRGNGLHFMDGWMAAHTLIPGLAAAGAQITVFQSGGGDMPFDPPVPAVNPGVVAPTFFMSGNPNLAEKLEIGLDFNSSAVLTGERTLPEIGAEILHALIETASGRLTWGETTNFKDATEVWFDGPFF
ncbi:UxaA family hydrolase [Burkholderia cepacia]|uniref:D-galactarate dehydratase/Altronate hydrolase domain-containing protein n=1 Tax=Burkholderia cepacia GG4 TaxID=1009846 RepID=A0A9W3K4S8_BURCE|nr:UxaA family hydrolase [Burkholderia cepacia]AFQ51074.1 D-galactarate dehydratase/Altronate hydrolase domain-containing protein [Burkholderia cepacia GG4]